MAKVKQGLARGAKCGKQDFGQWVKGLAEDRVNKSHFKALK